MKVLMFPGQGAQFKGMGAELFDAYPDMTAQADEILGYSIRSLCADDAERRLSNTRYTQPAIFVVSALSFRRYLDEGGERPDACAGHSLGEYAALHAGGVLDFESGLRLVKRRGELMANIVGGAMCAVIGLERERVESILESANVDIDVANHNSFTQIVLSGADATVREAERVLKAEAENCRVVRLQVSGAFHSRMMQSAAADFGEAVRRTRFSTPTAAVIANCSVEPYRLDSVVSNLERQLVSPVRWLETMKYFIDRQASTFLELGPGEVLSRLAKEIRSRYPSSRTASADRVSDSAEGAAGDRSDAPVSPPGATRPGNLENAARAPGNPLFERWGCANICVAGCIGTRFATPRLLAALAKAGVLVFAPGSGLGIKEVGERIDTARATIETAGARALIGLNIQSAGEGEHEAMLALAHEKAITAVELTGFMTPDAAILRYRARGLERGQGLSANKLLVKVRDLDSALAFARTPPEALIDSLLSDGSIDATQAATLRAQPVADAVCIDGSAWHESPDGQMSPVGTLIALARESIDEELGKSWPIVLGAAGAIGTPQDVVVARHSGAQFVVLGSALQICEEAGLSREIRARVAAAAPEEYRKVLDGFGLQYGLRSCAFRECPTTAAALDELQASLRGLLAGRQSAAEIRARLADRTWPLVFPPSSNTRELQRWLLECASLLGRSANERLLMGPAASAALRWWRRVHEGFPDAASFVERLQRDAGAIPQFAFTP